MANKAVYQGISLEKKILEEARKYAEEEGFTSVTAFIKWLIKSYPFIKQLKNLCTQNLLVPVTQAETHKQTEASRKGYYPLPFAETHTALINQADIKILIKELNVTNNFNVVVMEDDKLKELKEKVILKPLRDYEPAIEEVYENGLKVVSFKPKR